MNLQEFRANYARTLQHDCDTGQNYVKIPLSDLEDLAYMQASLLEAIAMLTQIEDKDKKELENSIYWISKILLAAYPDEELEGLARWLKA